ncbi:hypothetical protein [Clostridium baratii]|uniref:hypothetical protein n=1 Tax=Clostridium baratii TaxID=1561 RepID=UPI0030D2120B
MLLFQGGLFLISLLTLIVILKKKLTIYYNITCNVIIYGNHLGTILNIKIAKYFLFYLSITTNIYNTGRKKMVA